MTMDEAQRVVDAYVRTGPAAKPLGTPARVAIAVAGSLVIAALHPALGSDVHRWVLLAATAAAAVWFAVIDLRTFTLPNRLVGPLAAAAAAQLIAITVITGAVTPSANTIAAAAIVFLGYALIGMAGWMGFGDAKFAGALTLIVGLYAGLLAAYVLPLAMLIGAAQRALRGRLKPHDRYAHGPDIAAAVILIMLADGILGA